MTFMDSPLTSAVDCPGQFSTIPGIIIPQAALSPSHDGASSIVFYTTSDGQAGSTGAHSAVVPRGARVGVRLADMMTPDQPAVSSGQGDVQAMSMMLLIRVGPRLVPPRCLLVLT